MHAAAKFGRIPPPPRSDPRRTVPAALPIELQRTIFVVYRAGLRRRMAQRRLQATRRRCMLRELEGLFAFANGWNHIVLFLVGRTDDALRG